MRGSGREGEREREREKQCYSCVLTSIGELCTCCSGGCPAVHRACREVGRERLSLLTTENTHPAHLSPPTRAPSSRNTGKSISTWPCWFSARRVNGNVRRAMTGRAPRFDFKMAVFTAEQRSLAKQLIETITGLQVRESE